ncbi:MAG: hypothetical protein WDN25_28985 [Acetobacteraceae bacterium]
MPRRPPLRGHAGADAQARDLILRAALPRLFRLVPDPDAEARTLLSAVERRLGEASDPRRVTADELAALQDAVRRIIAAAADDERARRLAVLGTDGTP